MLVWSNQPRRHVQIKSDINYRIERLFRERGIKLPHPTQEFVLRGVESLAREPGLVANDKTSTKDSDHSIPSPHASDE